MRDIINRDTASILVDNQAVFHAIERFLMDFIPEKLGCLKLVSLKVPLFDAHNLEDQIITALNRSVPMKSGGYLVIDQTEAMTTVDVNTGAFVGRKDLEEKGQQADRVKWNISEISDLGLVEMTRKRTHESLLKVLCAPCSACDGKGYIKTPETVCLEIYREIQRKALKFAGHGCLIMASQPVIDRLLDEDAASVADLSQALGCTIKLQVETSYTQEQFDVVVPLHG